MHFCCTLYPTVGLSNEKKLDTSFVQIGSIEQFVKFIRFLSLIMVATGLLLRL